MLPIRTVSCLFPSLLAILAILSDCAGQSGHDTGWWAIWQYEGPQGPDYWGGYHSAWGLCSQGKKQSPIDLKPEKLLYDPDLQRFEIEAPRLISGVVQNTGRRVIFSVDSSNPPVRVYGGPLSYRYQLYEIEIKFGEDDSHGSEHTVNSKAFPLEVQLTFYNDRYISYARAEEAVQGLAKIGILVAAGNETSRELSKLTSVENVLQNIVYKGGEVNVTNLNVKQMLPRTFEYLTYEGSMTIPGCFETVTWIILNKPLRISSYQLNTLRELLRYSKEEQIYESLRKTFRPIQPFGRRVIRTNIARKVDNPEFEKACPKSRRQIKYAVNTSP